jgi:hypothetical protein
MEQISGVDGKKNEKENMKENGKEITNLWSTLLLCHDDYYMHSASALMGLILWDQKIHTCLDMYELKNERLSWAKLELP